MHTASLLKPPRDAAERRRAAAFARDEVGAVLSDARVREERVAEAHEEKLVAEHKKKAEEEELARENFHAEREQNKRRIDGTSARVSRVEDVRVPGTATLSGGWSRGNGPDDRAACRSRGRAGCARGAKCRGRGRC